MQARFPLKTTASKCWLGSFKSKQAWPTADTSHALPGVASHLTASLPFHSSRLPGLGGSRARSSRPLNTTNAMSPSKVSPRLMPASEREASSDLPGPSSQTIALHCQRQRREKINATTRVQNG